MQYILIMVSPTCTPLGSSPPPLSPVFIAFLSLENKQASKGNEVKCNKIKQKLTHQTWTKQRNKRKRAQTRQKKQRPICSHNQKVHKNTKVKAILYTKRTQYEPVQALCMLPQSLRVHIYSEHVHKKALFSWCPPSLLLHSFQLLTFFLIPLLQGSLSPKRRDLMEIAHLELSIPRSFTLCNVWLWLFVSLCCRRKFL